MPLKIGNVTFRNKGVLAPMLDYTNYSFRELCSKNHCALAYTEMQHISFVQNTGLDLLLNTLKKPSCHVSLQLVGDFTNQQSILSTLSRVFELKGFDILDFNLGCPSPNLISGNCGAILLDSIDKVSETLKVVKGISSKPVTAKIRLGYRFDNSFEILKKLELSGIDAVAVHGRLGVDDYSTPSNYKKVQQLARSTSLPVIYNGDINLTNIAIFKEIDEFSLLMVGRQALNNPSIFSMISGNKQRNAKENIMDFLRISRKSQNPLASQKLVLQQLVSGFAGARQFRAKLSLLKTQEELDALVSKLL